VNARLRGVLRRLRAHALLERLAIGAIWGCEEPPNPRHLIVLDYPLALRARYARTKPHPLLFALIDANRAAYASRLERIVAGLADFTAIPVAASTAGVEAGEPHWRNGFLPALDAMALYAFLVDGNPKRYLEVGSGNSTRFARRAIRDHRLRTRITSIDPHPRVEVERLCDESIRSRVEDIDLAPLLSLAAGDILFVDHSHRIFTNSDATTIFLDVLPYLKPGVLIQLHDVFLPYDYPDVWASRHYSEQYCLAAMLLADQRRYEIVLPNTFVSRDPQLAAILAPLWRHENLAGAEPHGVSFWLRVREPA
jgi:hypothetical protein